MVFGQKLESLFLFHFSAKESKTKCLVTFQIENQPFWTKNTRFKKSKTCIFLNLAFFQKGQSMVFGQKQKSLFLFSFLAKYSKTKCFVSLQKEIQRFQATKIGFKKVENCYFSKGVSLWFLVQQLEFFFWFFKQIGQNEVFCDLLDRTLAILDQKTSILKSRKFAFFQRDKSLVFGQNL